MKPRASMPATWVIPSIAKRRRHVGHHSAEGAGVGEDGGDVLEEDSRFGKSSDVSDQLDGMVVRHMRSLQQPVITAASDGPSHARPTFGASSWAVGDWLQGPPEDDCRRCHLPEWVPSWVGRTPPVEGPPSLGGDPPPRLLLAPAASALLPLSRAPKAETQRRSMSRCRRRCRRTAPGRSLGGSAHLARCPR